MCLLDKYGKMVSYRIKHEDSDEYNKIKKFIIDELGADMCFIQWNLLRAFFNGMTQAPNPKNEIELKFLRQNIQLNVGCTINYNRIKARRLPKPQPPVIKTDREFKLPLLLEDWDLLSEKSKAFWRQAIIDRGIMPGPDQDTHPLISDGTQYKRISFFEKVLSIVQQLLDKIRKVVTRTSTH